MLPRRVRGDRIGRSGVRRRVFVTLAVDRDLSDRQTLAELQNPRLTKHVRLIGPAQEVDAEIGGDRQADRSDRAQQGDIHADVGEQELGRPGDCPAWTQEALVVVHAHTRAPRAHLLDNEIPAVMEQLRKVLVQIGAHLLGIELD